MDPRASADPHEAYFEGLSKEEKQLVALKELLYDGSWDEIIADLKARRSGKPHVFRLETRIEEDLFRIEKLRAYETSHAVNLGAYLPKPEDVPERPRGRHEPRRR